MRLRCLRARTPWSRSLIYEAHARGLTMRHPRVQEELRGTYLGLASEPVIEHLRALGVTAVELMPVFEYPMNDCLGLPGPKTNYWGYDPLAFFAPHRGYAVGDEPGPATGNGLPLEHGDAPSRTG